MKCKILGVLSALMLVPAVQAGIVLSDTFSYPDGGIITNSAGVWIPNTGTANTMLVSNQQLIVSTSRSEDMAAALSGGPFQTNGATPALYASFKLKCTGLPTVGGAYFAHFTGANTFGALTGHRARLWSSLNNVAQARNAFSTNFVLYLLNSTNNITTAQWPTELTTNQTYTIVIKYQVANLTATMWVDPTSESDPNISGNDYPADLYDTANGVVNVSNYAFRQATGEGTMWIDDLKVGTSFSDVAGANTSPLISSIANQSTPRNAAVGPLPFTVQDAETTASSLIVSNSTSNPTLFPPGSIVLGGSATNRTVTVTPATGLQGSGTITLYVSDGPNTSSTSFSVTVGAPTISVIPSQISITNFPTAAIPFTISDAEGDSFTLSSNYSNPTLISSVVFGGSGANRTVTVTPAADQAGISTISVIASDGFNSATQSFTVTFAPLIGLIFSEDFSYPDGSLYGNGPWSFTSGTALETQVANGAVILSRTNSEDLNTGSGFGGGAPFASSSGVVLYSGFTLKAGELPSPAGNYFAHFKDTTTAGFRARVFAGTANAAAGSFRIGVANNSASVSAQVPNDLALNTPYLVVTRYNVASGESAIWVNPKSASDAPILATDLFSTLTVAQYALRQDTLMGTMVLDNLKVGTAMSDVVTIPPLTQTLTNTVVGTDSVLSWGQPLFALQSSTNVAGPYITIPGAASPYTNAISGNQTYFRLKY
jgi:hypothetical protein